MHLRRAASLFTLVVAGLAMLTGPAHAQDCTQLPDVFGCYNDRECVHETQFNDCGCYNGGLEAAINKSERKAHRIWRDECTQTGCLFIVVCKGFDGAYCNEGTCAMGSCGDGLVDPFGESCDDAGESAECDRDCTPAECGDFLVNATAGESCDDGNDEDGDGCSSQCVCDDASDIDADGLADACESCVGTGGASSAKLAFSKIGTDEVAGNDRAKFDIVYELSFGQVFDDLDPVSDGLTVTVRAADDRPVEVLVAPAGGFNGAFGWTRSATGFRYVDKGGLSAGVVSVAQVRPVGSGSEPMARVKLKVRDGVLATQASDGPLSLAVVPSVQAGACAEIFFERDECRASSRGNSIRCNRKIP